MRDLIIVTHRHRTRPNYQRQEGIPLHHPNLGRPCTPLGLERSTGKRLRERLFAPPSASHSLDFSLSTSLSLFLSPTRDPVLCKQRSVRGPVQRGRNPPCLSVPQGLPMFAARPNVPSAAKVISSRCAITSRSRRTADPLDVPDSQPPRSR